MPNALQQHPLDVSSSNKNSAKALLLARAEPSPEWSGTAGRDGYDHTRPRHEGASVARQDRAEQWPEARRAARSQQFHGQRSIQARWSFVSVVRKAPRS